MTNQQIVRYLKLPFQFNPDKLIHDLSLILENNWIPHFNSSGYSGEWDVIPLYASDGDEKNIFALAVDNSEVIETSLIKSCFYFREVIQSLEFQITSARLLKLGAGAEIKPHRDHELGYEDGYFRLHIPIVTNNKVRFVLDGELLTMRPGECWYTNVNFVHSVSNLGDSDRIHLVIDGIRNEWSDNLFFSLASKENLLQKQHEEESPETIKRTIEELKNSNEPIAPELIELLNKKLEKLTKNI